MFHKIVEQKTSYILQYIHIQRKKKKKLPFAFLFANANPNDEGSSRQGEK